MRAAVLEREGLILRSPEHCEAAFSCAHHARAAARDLVKRADVGPQRVGHGGPQSKARARSAIGENSCASLPATRSAHGSDRKSTRLNSSHHSISYAVFCLKK